MLTQFDSLCFGAPSCRLVPGRAALFSWATPSPALRWRSPLGGTRPPAPTSVSPVRSVCAPRRALSGSLTPLLHFLGVSAPINFEEVSITFWIFITFV